MALIKLYVGMSEARLLDHPLEAVRLLREAHATASESGYTALGLIAQAEICIPSIATGRLDDARAMAQDVLAEANAKGWGDLPGTAMAHGYLGWLALWQGEPERAVILLDRCAATLLPNDWGMLGLVTTVHAQACLSAGDVEGAERDTTRCRELAAHGRMPPWWPSLVQALDAMVLAASGRVAEASAVAGRPADGPQFHLAPCFRACVQLRAGDPRGSARDARRHPRRAPVPPHRGSGRGRARPGPARDRRPHGGPRGVERALDTAARFGLLEPFRMVGPVLAPLLTEHLRTGTRHVETVGRVLSHLVSASPAINGWGDTLTQRERTILRYLATDMSISEIARPSSSPPTRQDPREPPLPQARGRQPPLRRARGGSARPALTAVPRGPACVETSEA